ncbi:MAG: LysR family transcriptional regulator [Selenomonadaceae bacterium]|nr:LysR family transcriptional regulator [Selenomonadaceae bacterium]
MEFRVLKYFLAVAKHENISKAAEELHLTQPTLSRQLNELENELGAALLIRGKRKTTLTEAGLFLKARAEEITALTNKTIEQFAKADELIEGDVYIGCGETEGMRHVIGALAPLQQKHKGIRIHLNSSSRELVDDWLDKGILDFGLMCCAMPPVDYVYRKIPHEDIWGLFMHESNPLSTKDGIAPEDLIDEPLIVSRQALKSKEFDHWLGYSAEELKIVSTYNLAFNAAFFAEQKIGSVLSFKDLINTDSEARKNIIFRPLVPTLHSNNYLIWKKGQIFSRVGRLVKETFEAIFR